MRYKLALTVALASLAVLAALGVNMAGADTDGSTGPSGSTGAQILGGQTAIAPGPETVPAPAPPAACSNEIDDDGDGLVDLADPDCTSPTDTEEGPEGSTG